MKEGLSLVWDEGECCWLDGQRHPWCSKVPASFLGNLVRYIASSLSRNSLHENCGSLIPKNPAFHSADHLCRLLLNFWLLDLVFLSCYPGTLGGCTWGKRKGSVSFLPRQVVLALILPVFFPRVRENIPLQLLFLFFLAATADTR